MKRKKKKLKPKLNVNWNAELWTLHIAQYYNTVSQFALWFVLLCFIACSVCGGRGKRQNDKGASNLTLTFWRFLSATKPKSKSERDWQKSIEGFRLRSSSSCCSSSTFSFFLSVCFSQSVLYRMARRPIEKKENALPSVLWISVQNQRPKFIRLSSQTQCQM